MLGLFRDLPDGELVDEEPGDSAWAGEGGKEAQQLFFRRLRPPDMWPDRRPPGILRMCIGHFAMI
jgi:hypothetical protein